MRIYVENALKDVKGGNAEVFNQKTHFIPCSIESNGPAEVEKYFEKYVQDEKDSLSATFRGHPLQGVQTKLPEGYRAVVVTEAKRPLAENAERRFQVAGGFKQFTHWNWDKKPSQNDPIAQAMDWMDIAEAIHGD